MKCSACQHDNREGAKFCEECAAPLKRACSRCGCELRPTAKFCDDCGTPAVSTTSAAPLTARPVSDYTPAHLAECIRAEQAALELMVDAVHQYDGYVAQALGDGIFALFGAPLVHEDHPQRAIYAALRMQEAMGRYADTLRSKGYPPLQMRVGLNTGEVVVRSIRKDDLHTDYVPVGHYGTDSVDAPIIGRGEH